MSHLSRPWLARTVARLLQPMGGVMMRVDESVRFAEIPARTQALRIPTTTTGSVSALAYLPERPVGAPVYLNFHGSGYIIRHPEQDDSLCRYLAHHAGIVVVNVDYDVAPQRPFPVAPRQAYEVFRWVLHNGGRYGWDISRIGVGGQSAGGTMSEGIVRIALETGSPTPQALVMLYPPLDVTPGIVWPPPRAEKPVLTPELAEIFTAAYIADPENRYDPLASPACPRNIASIPALPPTLLISGELDMLREQSERYADALRGAGVDLSFWMAPGADHSFTLKGPRDVAIEAFDRIVAHLERTIALPQSRPSAS